MERKALLQKHNIQNTRARRELLKAIFSLEKRHFSVEDVLDVSKRRNYKISRATAFRAMSLFSDRGLLNPIDLGKGFMMYELTQDNGHHDHLYCVKCGEIIEFEDEMIENLQHKICEDKEFHFLKHTLRIVGVCNKCR